MSQFEALTALVNKKLAAKKEDEEGVAYETSTTVDADGVTHEGTTYEVKEASTAEDAATLDADFIKETIKQAELVGDNHMGEHGDLFKSAVDTCLMLKSAGIDLAFGDEDVSSPASLLKAAAVLTDRVLKRSGV